MKVAIPKENAAHERRVALDPDRVARLKKRGFELLVQAGAGERAFFSDAAFQEAGATLVADAGELYAQADAVLQINRPADAQIDALREGSVLIAFLFPLADRALVQRLLDRKVSSFSMDLVPRIARAQKMDALSSMSSLAGYKAVLIAADSLGKYFPMMMTAAGTVPPSKVFILGAGVAGLQAIATAKRLGANVSAYDVRPVVKEQVESLGASFLQIELDESTEDEGGYAKELSEEAKRRGEALIHEHLKQVDVVITTAQIPGKPAPRLITEAMVKDMKPGSVIVDLAAETGGNCELTQAGEVRTVHNVVIHGPENVPSSLPIHASQLYARNIGALFDHLTKDTALHLDFEDEVTRESCATHQGAVVSKRLKDVFGQSA